MNHGGRNPLGTNSLPNTRFSAPGIPAAWSRCTTCVYSWTTSVRSQSRWSFSSESDGGGTAKRFIARYGTTVANPFASSVSSETTTSTRPAGAP